MRRLVVLFAASVAMLLAGCESDSLDIGSLGDQEPVVQSSSDVTVAEGTAASILPVVIHPGFDTSTSSPIESVRSDDSNIAAIVYTSHLYDVDGNSSEHGVLIQGVHAGTTTCRLYADDSDDSQIDSFTVTVVAQAH
jgi:hypothetical protein